jgi:hypothetical protein
VPAAAVNSDLAPSVEVSDWRNEGPERRLDRILAGEATLLPDKVQFIGSNQPTRDWTAAVEFTLPVGSALQSTTRDLALIILGGTVSWALLPARLGQPRAKSVIEPRAACRRRIAGERPGDRKRPTPEANLSRSGLTAPSMEPPPPRSTTPGGQ